MGVAEQPLSNLQALSAQDLLDLARGSDFGTEEEARKALVSLALSDAAAMNAVISAIGSRGDSERILTGILKQPIELLRTNPEAGAVMPEIRRALGVRFSIDRSKTVLRSSPVGGIWSWLQISVHDGWADVGWPWASWGETFKRFLPAPPLPTFGSRRCRGGLTPRCAQGSSPSKLDPKAVLHRYRATLEPWKEPNRMLPWLSTRISSWPPEKWHSINGPVLINW